MDTLIPQPDADLDASERRLSTAMLATLTRAAKRCLDGTTEDDHLERQRLQEALEYLWRRGEASLNDVRQSQGLPPVTGPA